MTAVFRLYTYDSGNAYIRKTSTYHFCEEIKTSRDILASCWVIFASCGRRLAEINYIYQPFEASPGWKCVIRIIV